ncbi:MAG: 50S ribosomal protein L29 [Flavobacteriales bacterium]|nr:MAG: 50S ribosomal protein L29 [Flavobacteriales bacterium]
MKASVIKEMKTVEIEDKVLEDTEMLNKLKMNHAVSPLENPLQLRHLKKNISRLKTEIRYRQLNADAKQNNES